MRAGRPAPTALEQPCGMTIAAETVPLAAQRLQDLALEWGQDVGREDLRRGAPIEVDERVVERGAPAAHVVEDEPEDRREGEREHERHEQGRAIAHALAQVLAGDQERRAHQSRSALPVRCRKTASRSGWSTSTPRTAAPASVAARRSSGSRVLASWTITASDPSAALAATTPGSEAIAAAAGSSPPLASINTRSCSPTSATSWARVPSALISPRSTMPIRSHRRSASSM